MGTSDELKARVDSLSAELEQAKQAAEVKTDTDSSVDVDALVAARLELIQQSQPHLDADFAFTGKSDRQVREAVITAIHGDSVELESRTDAYVEARFDAVVDLASSADSSLPLRQQLSSALRSDATDPSKCDGDMARKAYMDRQKEQWKKSRTKGAN